MSTPQIVRLSIQDYADSPNRPEARVVEIPLSNGFIISEKEASRWRRLLNKVFRKGGQAAVIIATAVLAQKVAAAYGLTPAHEPLIMGAITSAVATSFKGELGTATHNFTAGQHVVKCALYTSAATLGAATTAYSATNEITGTGYVAAGTALTNSTPVTSGTTAIFDWTDAQWTSATFTANGCLVYNVTASNKAIFVIAFGSDQSVTAGTFTIQWPTPDASNAIIRIS